MQAHEIQSGQIVRYTDATGEPHDAIVDAMVAGMVSIQYQPFVTPMALWVRPEALSVPR